MFLWSVAYGQVCADEDTVRSNAASLITATTARINGTVAHFTSAPTSLQLRYVRVGQTDTATASSAPTTALRNLTGLQPNTQYVYYYKTICGSGTRSQNIGAYTFTTLASTIVYATERSTQFRPYALVDSVLQFGATDTILNRAQNLPSIAYKSSNNTFYGYYPSCTCWRPLAIDSSGIIALLDGKVDSVTVSGDSLFYWKVGVSYGYILPATLLNNLTGNMVYVDGTNGSDITGTIGNESKPYQTLSSAKTDATAGYTIVVRPGTYTTTTNLAKNGVNWYFEPGAVVTMASDLDSTAIFDDGGTAMTFTVSGYGKFTRSTTDDFLKINCVNVSHASSNVTIQADQLITTAGTDGESSVVRQSAGTVNVSSRLITVTGGNAYGVWWFNGTMNIQAVKIQAEYACISSAVNAAPTGDCYIHADDISGVLGVSTNGTNSTAAIWVTSNTVRGKVYSNGSNRIYVECQKIFGIVELTINAGLVYVKTDKISDTGDGLISTIGGTLRLTVNHLDPDGHTAPITIAGGEIQLNNGYYVGGATATGFSISSGTATLTNCLINTSANSGTSPITKSGGTLTLVSTLLTAEGTVNGISAPTSQTVISYGSVSNRPLDADVVLSGDMTVNSLSYNSNIASGVGTKALRYNPTTEQITYEDTTLVSVTASSTTTFTNKRWTARVGSATSSATPTINTDNYDVYKLTAQAADITSFTTNLSGTPADGDILEIQITGTASRAITWGSSFVSTTVTLPTTTSGTATLTVIVQYYTTSSYGNNKWHCVNYY